MNMIFFQAGKSGDLSVKGSSICKGSRVMKNVVFPESLEVVWDW